MDQVINLLSLNSKFECYCLLCKSESEPLIFFFASCQKGLSIKGDRCRRRRELCFLIPVCTLGRPLQSRWLLQSLVSAAHIAFPASGTQLSQHKQLPQGSAPKACTTSPAPDSCGAWWRKAPETNSFHLQPLPVVL